MKTTLFLARHGETQWNKMKRFQGQLDSELTVLGEEQSRQIAKYVTDKEVDLIISSSLTRAVTSAKICQQTLAISMKTNVGLIERHLGEWQGELISNIKNAPNYTEILYQYTNVTPTGGECAITCGKRMYRSLELLGKQHLGKNILVISHGEALRCFFSMLGCFSNNNHVKNNAYDLFKNGAISTVTYHHPSAQFQLIHNTY